MLKGSNKGVDVLGSVPYSSPINSTHTRKHDMRQVLASYPAFDVVKPYTALEFNGEEILNVDDNSEIYMLDLQAKFKLSSVMSYAIQYNECPIEAYQRAVEKGHNVYYMVALGATISNRKEEKRKLVGLEIGQKIQYMGKIFELKKAPNKNVNLVEIGG